jgi:hypothetical protein
MTKPSATLVREDDSLVRVLEATVEILKTENEILKRRLAAAETWAAQVVITKRLDTLAPTSATPAPAERASPWWRRLARESRPKGRDAPNPLGEQGAHS